MNKKPVYIDYLSMVSPLGNTVEAHVHAFENGISGIRIAHKAGFQDTDIPLAKREEITSDRYDSLLREALEKAQAAFPNTAGKTAVIVSSTKGNLDLLPGDTFAGTKPLIHTFFPEQTFSFFPMPAFPESLPSIPPQITCKPENTVTYSL